MRSFVWPCCPYINLTMYNATDVVEVVAEALVEGSAQTLKVVRED